MKARFVTLMLALVLGACSANVGGRGEGHAQFNLGQTAAPPSYAPSDVPPPPPGPPLGPPAWSQGAPSVGRVRQDHRVECIRDNPQGCFRCFVQDRRPAASDQDGNGWCSRPTFPSVSSGTQSAPPVTLPSAPPAQKQAVMPPPVKKPPKMAKAEERKKPPHVKQVPHGDACEAWVHLYVPKGQEGGVMCKDGKFAVDKVAAPPAALPAPPVASAPAPVPPVASAPPTPAPTAAPAVVTPPEPAKAPEATKEEKTPPK